MSAPLPLHMTVSRRPALLLCAAYLELAMAGSVTHRQIFQPLALLLVGACRRWRRRHPSQPRLHSMLLQRAVHWSELLRGKGAPSA